MLRLAALVFAAAILLPLLFGSSRIVEGQSGGDGWRNFIYDFQTLLTGILAIAAAWWNVSAMKAADASSDKRHNEVLEKARLDQQRIIERVVNPQTAQMRTASVILGMHKRTIMKVNTLEGQLERISISVHMMDFIITQLADIISRPQLREGMRLFDGEVTYKIHALEKRIEKAKEAATKVYERREEDDFGFMKKPARELDVLYGFMTRSEDEIEEVLEGLKGIASQYGVEIKGLEHK